MSSPVFSDIFTECNRLLVRVKKLVRDRAVLRVELANLAAMAEAEVEALQHGGFLAMKRPEILRWSRAAKRARAILARTEDAP